MTIILWAGILFPFQAQDRRAPPCEDGSAVKTLLQRGDDRRRRAYVALEGLKAQRSEEVLLSNQNTVLSNQNPVCCRVPLNSIRDLMLRSYLRCLIVFVLFVSQAIGFLNWSCPGEHLSSKHFSKLTEPFSRLGFGMLGCGFLQAVACGTRGRVPSQAFVHAAVGNGCSGSTHGLIWPAHALGALERSGTGGRHDS